jgi:hypothetical protein
MAPRWIRTKDHKPLSSTPPYGQDDWLLISGNWVVGRVLPASGDPQRGRYKWSLTGPHTPEAPMPKGGTEPDAERAKDALLAAWRAWQFWAGMQDRPDGVISS